MISRTFLRDVGHSPCVTAITLMLGWGRYGRCNGEDSDRALFGDPFQISDSSKRFQFGDFVSGVFTPVLAKHSKHLNLVDILAVGVDRMQGNFEPMQKQVDVWKGTRLADESAKLVIYKSFVEGELDVPKHLARRVHDLYFNPTVDEFAPRTTWSLSNAFTSAFKELDPIPQFKATAKLASFLEASTVRLN